MLGNRDINRIVDSVREYNTLLEKSERVRDGLSEARKAWGILLSEQERLRVESEGMVRSIAQFKEDFQTLHVREARWGNSVADLHLCLQFMVDEIGTIVGRHRRKSVRGREYVS